MCREVLGINDLVEAANRDDRLGLLYDSTAAAGNLTNAIHPLFHDSCFLEQSLHLKQALQLASLFLQYDSLLEFFIPLSYGRTHIDGVTGKKYLTNPVASKSRAELKSYIAGVRHALHCLEHCIVFRWNNPTAQRLWARTILYPVRQPEHTSTCSTHFHYKNSVLIELNVAMLNFYKDDKTGYKQSHRCDQFRHDFQIAVTIIHEVIHAYGAMRRGDLTEPQIRCDHPDQAEWGYAWENFMFGAIINPQDRVRPGTHIQLRKTWADPRREMEVDGKEYSAVSMSWIAQWFQRETWDKIEKGGPLAIPSSTVNIKFRSSRRHQRWFVLTDAPETQEDIMKINHEAVQTCAKNKVSGTHTLNRDIEVAKVQWKLVDSERLQQSNIPVPMRVPPKIIFSEVASPTKRLSVAADFYSASSMSSAGSTTTTTSTTTLTKTALKNTSSSSATHGKRARDDDTVSTTRPSKVVKRITSR